MELYHFCREKDWRGIRTDGITRGMIPKYTKVGGPKGLNRDVLTIIDGWQWLTAEPRRDHQSWATKYLLKAGMNRTEIRITVEIPEKEADSLYTRDRIAGVYPDVDFLFEGWPGSENWRVFRGKIPKYWIRKAEKWNPEKEAWEILYEPKN